MITALLDETGLLETDLEIIWKFFIHYNANSLHLT